MESKDFIPPKHPLEANATIAMVTRVCGLLKTEISRLDYSLQQKMCFASPVLCQFKLPASSGVFKDSIYLQENLKL